MRPSTWARALLAVLASVSASAPALVEAQQLAGEVAVKVRLQTSSGACGVRDQAAEVGVACAPPGGSLLPAPGAVSYQRVGAIQQAGVVSEPLAVYSDGVKITSWRMVRLDNAEYLELTVTW